MVHETGCNISELSLVARLKCLNVVKVSRFRCYHRFKYVLIHPPVSLACLCRLLTRYVKLRRLSCETKTLKPAKSPAEECLTINPFISILNINEFPLGSFSLSLSLICLSSPSLCLLFLNHSQTKPSVLFRDTQTPRQLSTCLCVFATFVLLPSFKVEMCIQTWKLLATPHYEEYYF